MKEPSQGKIGLELEDRGEAGRVARITVAYPEKLNILNTPLLLQFAEVIQGLGELQDLRAAILTGAGGRSFIGGADIREMAGLEPESARAFISRLHAVCQGLRDLSVPVIARIDGFCIGGGLEIAASCDLRVASDRSIFGMPEVRVGIPSVIEAALLPRLAGWGRAREIIYTGESIKAGDALAFGFIERSVPCEKLDETVEEWLTAILKNGANAMRLQKKLLREWEELPLARSIERSIEYFGEAFATTEPRGMMQGFLNRKR